jgi:curved DNA-binding protein CbpA
MKKFLFSIYSSFLLLISSPIAVAAASRQRMNNGSGNNNNNSKGKGNSNNNSDNGDTTTQEEAWDFFKNVVQQKDDRNKPRDVIEASISAFQTLLGGGLAAGTTFIGFPLGMSAFIAFGSYTVKNDNINTGGDDNDKKKDGVVLPTILGFVVGGFVGSASALTVSLYSIYRAGTTLWSGLVETPETLKSWIIERKKWDPYERRWKNRTSLENERQELLLQLQEQEAEAAKRRRNQKVADTGLYDLLEISSDASKSIIKKAYFSKARDTHPDKNRDDPLAHQKFVELHEAYSILSDDDKRSVYDRGGGDNFSQFINFDASVFVAVFFSGGGSSSSSSESEESSESMSSSPIVENFVGELGLTSFVDTSFKFLSIIQMAKSQDDTEENPLDLNEQILRYVQEYFNEDDMNKNKLRRKMRSIEIASYLVNKTSSLVNDDTTCKNNDVDPTTTSFDDCLSPEQRFRKEIYTDGMQILNDSDFYGQTYLEIIGSSILAETSFFKTLVPLGVRNTYQKWYTRKEFVQAGYNLYMKVVDLTHIAAAKNNNDINDYENLVESLPDLMRLINVYNQMDISTTLREAIWRILNDPGSTRKERNNRYRTMKIIGEEFMKLAKTIGDEDKVDGDVGIDDSYHKMPIEEIKSKFLLAYKLAAKKG